MDTHLAKRPSVYVCLNNKIKYMFTKITDPISPFESTGYTVFRDSKTTKA